MRSPIWASMSAVLLFELWKQLSPRFFLCGGGDPFDQFTKIAADCAIGDRLKRCQQSDRGSVRDELCRHGIARSNGRTAKEGVDRDIKDFGDQRKPSSADPVRALFV